MVTCQITVTNTVTDSGIDFKCISLIDDNISHLNIPGVGPGCHKFDENDLKYQCRTRWSDITL